MWVVICTYTVSALSLWTYTYGRESLRVSARGSFDSQCLEVIRDRGEVAGWCVATATANQRPKKNFPLCAPIFSPSRSLSSLSPLPCCLSLFLHLFFLRSFIRLVSFSTLSSRAKVCLALALKSSLSLSLSLILSLSLSRSLVISRYGRERMLARDNVCSNTSNHIRIYILDASCASCAFARHASRSLHAPKFSELSVWFSAPLCSVAVRNVSFVPH